LEGTADHAGSVEIDRTFLHVDMDAFFASVEIRDNPALEGRPVAVGGSRPNRGVITAANYIARRYGLRAGMTSLEARRRCPHAVFLPVEGAKYTYVSAQIMAALERFSPEVRPLSIDEASLEITGCLKLYGSPEKLGRSLKDMIRSRFRLPCTVGIGPNRLVAKMGANLGKPDGLKVIGAGEAAEIFAPLPVDRMIGIGGSTARALYSLGINTLGQLGAAPEKLLKSCFGVYGPVMAKLARGEWSGGMRRDEERSPVEKSMGHQRTFGEPLSEPGALRGKLVALAEMVARRVRRAGMQGRVLTLTVRYTDFRTVSHQTRLPEPTDDEEDIILHGWMLFDEVYDIGSNVRLLGLSLGSLRPRAGACPQIDLFDSHVRLKRRLLYRALDDLRDRFGERVIARAMGMRWEPRGRDRPGGDPLETLMR
ncbi:MAG TPA: DNA polymerase IV, partial [Bacteroidetes bacterium]|nr:DNA polymerase IV [Bacteroidota bacterium]